MQTNPSALATSFKPPLFLCPYKRTPQQRPPLPNHLSSYVHANEPSPPPPPPTHTHTLVTPSKPPLFLCPCKGTPQQRPPLQVEDHLCSHYIPLTYHHPSKDINLHISIQTNPSPTSTLSRPFPWSSGVGGCIYIYIYIAHLFLCATLSVFQSRCAYFFLYAALYPQ